MNCAVKPMKVKCLYIVSPFLIFFSVAAFTQERIVKNDTVYIYEEVIVYDTTYVYDTIYVTNNSVGFPPLKSKDIKCLLFDTVNNKVDLLMISGKRAATIPINGETLKILKV